MIFVDIELQARSEAAMVRSLALLAGSVTVAGSTELDGVSVALRLQTPNGTQEGLSGDLGGEAKGMTSRVQQDAPAVWRRLVRRRRSSQPDRLGLGHVEVVHREV